MDGDGTAMDMFCPGGALAYDSAWKDFAAKNF